MRTSIGVALAVVFLVASASVIPAQTPRTRIVMRDKLVHSQRILEAILASDFALLRRESQALARATEDPAWKVLQGPEYLRQSEAFLKALGELDTAAKGYDLDSAAERFSALTMTCFGCHRYMKDQRIAGQ